MEPPRSRTLPHLLDELCERFPDGMAVVGGGDELSYCELRRRSRAFAGGLAGLGVAAGDRVALLMQNRPEWLVAYFGIATLGAATVAINTWATARELEYMLRHSGSRALVTVDRFLGNDYLATLAAISPRRDRLPALERVVCLADDMVVEPAEDAVAFAALAGGPEIAGDVAVAPEAQAAMLYTSGSTSTPKAVPILHRGLIENGWNIGERLAMARGDRVWLPSPLFWGFGCENALFVSFTHGAGLVVQDVFDAGEALRLLEEQRCTMIYATANMLHAVLDHPDLGARELGALRGGATLGTPAQIERAASLAPEICHVYGLTETYANCITTRHDDDLEIRKHSIGYPLPGMDVVIADPRTHRPLAPGEIGEIKVRGYVTPGYHDDPERNAASFDDEGYLLTGDLALVGDDGRIYFRGRLKEMIKTGGINVSPIEVEEALRDHPAVREAFVTGVADPSHDEIVGAVIVPAGEGVAAAELTEFCRRTLAAYKVPRAFRFVTAEQLPVTATGKLQKSRLPELFAGTVARPGEAP